MAGRLEALHGGQTTPIWIVNLKTLDLVKVPRENSNDSNPVWVGDSVYFLSDRNGPVSLFRYDTGSQRGEAGVPQHGLRPETVQAGPGGLVYEQFGSIHLLTRPRTPTRAVPIQIRGELPNLAPHRIDVPADEIQNAGLSPTGRAGRL